MKIRYYLRGLGLGILVTTIFILVGDGSNKTMSDEQIKARAKELGMIENTVLAEISTEEIIESTEDEAAIEENSIEAAAETKAEVLEETSEAVIEETTEVVETIESEEETTEEESVEEVSLEAEEKEASSEAEEDNSVEETVSTAANSEAVSIVVHSGEGSDDVSRRLADMGLVADAHEYDRYLMTNGYDKKIRTGEHIIPAGATWEEMAKILCNYR